MAALLHRLRSDEALLRAYAAGDGSAFNCLYQRHKDGLYAYLYRVCPRPAIVEELAQDTWMAVVDKADSYQVSAAFRTWLYRIAHNRCVDFWRRADNRHLGSAELPEQVSDIDSSDITAHQVLQMVGQLPREQKDALLLQEQGFSIAEIATITGSGDETVKSRLRYARKQLQTLLEGEL